MDSKVSFIKNIYLYLVSFVALFMIVFSVADMVNIGLKTFLFPKADSYGYYPEPACPVLPDENATSTDPRGKDYCVSKEERERAEKENRSAQRQRDLVRDISFLIVGLPLFAYHWMIIRRKEV